MAENTAKPDGTKSGNDSSKHQKQNIESTSNTAHQQTLFQTTDAEFTLQTTCLTIASPNPDIETLGIFNSPNKKSGSFIRSPHKSPPRSAATPHQNDKNNKRKASTDNTDIDELSKSRKTNVLSNDGESGLGSSLCDILEESIKNNVSESFAKLKHDIEVKENCITRLQNQLQNSNDEKKTLEQQFAAEKAEKEKLVSEIADLRKKSQMKTCVQCEANIDLPTFCSTGCLL